MRQGLIPICCLLIFSSCKEKDVYSEHFLKSYTYEGLSSVYIVVPVDEDRYICINNDVLRDIVFTDYYQQSYDHYLSFLHVLFNKPKDINIMQYFDKDNVFKVAESNIWREYKREGFNYIMNNYITEEGTQENLVANIKGKRDVLAIVKIMFDNNYFVFFDDYESHFYFSKKNIPVIIIED